MNHFDIFADFLNVICPGFVITASFVYALSSWKFRYLMMIIFAICNSLFGKLLKRIFRCRRPSHSKKINSSYGMPSSHSNSLFFFVSFLTCDNLGRGYGVAFCTFLLLTMYSSAICYCRIFITKDHDIYQIMAGVCLGSFNGMMSCLYVLPYVEKYALNLP